jgi:integrase
VVKQYERRHFGNIRKRQSGNWQASYKVDGQSFSLGTFSFKADAQAALAEIEVSVNRGTWISPELSMVTLSEYATEWLENRHNLSPRTYEHYEYLLRKYILPDLGQRELKEISPPMVRKWHGTHASKHISTASKAYRLLSTIMKTAVEDELLNASPCRVRGAGQEHAPERPIATVEEVHLMREAMPERLQIMIDFAVWCQMRRGEIFGLQRGDFDLQERTVNIVRSRTFLTKGEALIKSPKTAAGKRKITIPQRMMTDLELHLSAFTDNTPESFLINGRDGSPISSMAFQRSWHMAREAIGRTDLHFHDLRHTGLTLAAATGATTAELMRRAGHASPDAALRYQHATLERDNLLASKLDAI